MPIFTTAVSGSGTNRSTGLSQGGVASHFTGSLHVFSGSWSGQRALNITGSIAVSGDVIVGGDIKTFAKGGPESVHTAISIAKNVATPKVTLAGDLQIGGNDIFDSGGAAAVTFDGSQNTEIKGNLQVDGNIAGDADESKTIFAESTSAGSTITLGGGGTVIAAGDLQVDGNIAGDANESKTIFAESTSAGSTITIGGGGDVVVGGSGDLKLSTSGLINDSGGHARFAAPDGTATLIKDIDGTTVITVHASDLSTTLAGDLHVDGGDIYGPAGGQLRIRSDANVIVQLDEDNNGTNKFVIWDQSENPIFEIDESGSVQMDGTITIGGNIIKASDGGSAITLDTSDNVTIGNNLILGNNIIKNSDDETAITLDADQNVTIQGDLTVVGNDIKNTAGNLTIDSTGNILLDADGGNVTLKDDGTYGLNMYQANAGDWTFESLTQNKDIIFKVNDSGSPLDVLRMTGIDRAGVIINEGANQDVDFRVESRNSTHMLYVDGYDDFVGIGVDGVTLSPSPRFHVEHSDNTTAAASNVMGDFTMLLKNLSTTTNAFAGIAFDVTSETNEDAIGAAIRAERDTSASTTAGNHDANLTFATNNASDDGLTERMRITHDGLVGIGTALPSHSLDVTGDARITGDLTIGEGAAEDASLVFDGNSKDWYVAVDDTSSRFIIGQGSGITTNNRAIEILESGGATLTAISGTLKLSSTIQSSDGANCILTSGGNTTVYGQLLAIGGILKVTGTDPYITIGDGGAEDPKLLFDGNAADFYMGLDDTDDKLHIGLGSAVGTTPNMTLDSATRDVLFAGDISVGGNDIKDSGGAAAITFDGSQNTTLAGDLKISGNSIEDSGGNVAISFDTPGVSIVGTTPTLTIGDGGNEDVKVLFNSDVNDYYIGSDATDDTLNLGKGTSVGTTSAIRITSGSLVEFPYGVNISPAVDVDTNVPVGNDYWLPILGGVDSANQDISTGVYLVTLTGGDYAGAAREADWQFIVNLRYGLWGPTADADATSLTVEQLNTSILGSSVVAFDPTTDIKIACEGIATEARVWIKSTSAYKTCFVSCLGGGVSKDNATNSYIDPAWEILTSQAWQSSEPVGSSTNWYGQWATKIFASLDITDQGGLILGYSAYDPNTQEDWTTTGTAFAFVEDALSNTKSITFTASLSGKVEITAKLWVNQEPTIFLNYFLKMALGDHPSSWNTVTGTEKIVFLTSEHASVGTQGLVNMSWVITGLTSGTSYTYYLGAAESNAAQEHILSWGEDYPALIMQAVSLPDTITS